MSFASPAWLCAFVLLLPLGVWGGLFRDRRAERVGGCFAPENARPARKWVTRKRLAFVALSLLVFSLAGPTWGEEREWMEVRGDDLYFLVDCSLSMLAEDVPPSRLAAGTLLAASIVKGAEGCRAGLIAFAGKAFPVCPLTPDTELVRSHLSNLDPRSQDSRGTDFQEAGETLLKTLSRRDTGRRLTVVLVSDGEAFHPLDDLTAEKIRGLEGVRVAVVGVGTAAGASIPSGSAQANPLPVLDSRGIPVVTRLDEDRLKSVARLADGAYFRFETVGITSRAFQETFFKGAAVADRLEKKVPRRHDALFAWAGFLLLAAAATARVRRPPKGPTPVASAAAFLAFSCLACATGRQTVADGNRLLESGDLEGASRVYQRVLDGGWPGGEKGAAALNYMYCQLLRERFQQAASWGKRWEPEAGETRAAFSYDLAIALYHSGEREAAARRWRRCVEAQPADADAAWNFEMCLVEPPAPRPPPDSPPPPPSPDTRLGAERLLDAAREKERPVPPRPRPSKGEARTGEPFW